MIIIHAASFHLVITWQKSCTSVTTNIAVIILFIIDPLVNQNAQKIH